MTIEGGKEASLVERLEAPLTMSMFVNERHLLREALRQRAEAAARIRALEGDNNKLRDTIRAREQLKASLGIDFDGLATEAATTLAERLLKAKAQASTYREALERSRGFAAHYHGCASYQMTAKGSPPCDCGHDDVFRALSSSHGGGNG